MGCDVPESSYEACRNCASMKSHSVITDQQNEKCVDDPSTVRAVSQGSRHAILDCQRRFNNSQWNCSTFISQPIFGDFIGMQNFLIGCCRSES